MYIEILPDLTESKYGHCKSMQIFYVYIFVFFCVVVIIILIVFQSQM